MRSHRNSGYDTFDNFEGIPFNGLMSQNKRSCSAYRSKLRIYCFQFVRTPHTTTAAPQVLGAGRGVDWWQKELVAAGGGAQRRDALVRPPPQNAHCAELSYGTRSRAWWSMNRSNKQKAKGKVIFQPNEWVSAHTHKQHPLTKSPHHLPSIILL